MNTDTEKRRRRLHSYRENTMTRKNIFAIFLILLVSSCGLRERFVAGPETTRPATSVDAPPVVEKPTPAITETPTPTPKGKKDEPSPYLWGNNDYDGDPWVKNVSNPVEITQGLQNRHITVWPSHGIYYDQTKQAWKWQRPYLFGTTEDLFTQTIVVPFLVPMLEKAGANVFIPRERDWQRNEVIVDNDDQGAPNYVEKNTSNRWQDAEVAGFSWKQQVYQDDENPFEAGTTRKAKTTKMFGSEIVYQPNIPENGSYAVYVSYPTIDKSVTNAEYTVYHQGQTTVFHVNQQMGGGTWVYLGTFDFDKGCNQYNRVVLSNVSNQKGYITADAVRFGGGMGNVMRGGKTSGLPRCLEGARYYAQWAGAPYSVYSFKAGTDDYRDDIYTRSYMSNWLSGGSCYLPDSTGKKVPIELSLAVHSDAGFHKDYKSVYGTLSICTTDHNNGMYDGGIGRNASKIFARSLLDGLNADLSAKYGSWVIRELWDRNYAETRCPEVPSAILETLSHQSFPDMILAQDPGFRFTMARSIYKTILKFMNEAHGKHYTVAPLPPKDIRCEFTSIDEISLKWDATTDEQEKTAKPTSYIVYKKTGIGSFDNGTVVKNNHFKMKLEPGVIYSFKVAAVNKGGESFPSETVSALHNAGATRAILIVNGFHRVSAPAVRETPTEQGFDYDIDPGVNWGKTAGMSGRQTCFDKKKIGIEGPGGLGYGSDEWVGKFIAGNDFNYAYTHTEAMKGLLKYNISSCCSHAIENGQVDIKKYHLVDLILGLEKKDGNKAESYQAFSKKMQEKLTDYAHSGGSLLVSGAYIGSDMTSAADSVFLSNVLKVRSGGFIRNTPNATINGMGTSFEYYNQLNEEHYAATSTDILLPSAPAYTALLYAGGTSAGVAYSGNDYRTFTMGFPFECITSYRKRFAIMKAIVSFLVEQD